MAMTITDEHRRRFREDGIVKLPGVLEPALLDELKACFESAVTETGPTLFQTGNPDSDAFTLVDFDNRAHRALYERAISHGPFAQLASDLWQSDFVGFLCEEVFWKKGHAARTFWHQDTSYWHWAGSHWANFWIPFSALEAEYALQVVRGSHRGRMYDGTTFNPKDPTEPLWGAAANFPRLPDIAADLAADPTSWDVVSYDVDVGDVIVIHPHCLHAGGGTDANVPERRTLVFRFFGDDSYYSDHVPKTPSMYKYEPIPSATGGFLADGDPYRPATAGNLNPNAHT